MSYRKSMNFIIIHYCWLSKSAGMIAKNLNQSQGITQSRLHSTARTRGDLHNYIRPDHKTNAQTDTVAVPPFLTPIKTQSL